MVFWSVLCLVLCPFVLVSNAGSYSSCIIATRSTPRISGRSPSPASCTLALWVRSIRVPHQAAGTLWTNVYRIVTGVMILISQARGWDGVWTTINVNVNLSIPSTSISVSLNTLLTFMIIIRLVLHRRNTRAATGSPAGIGGLYKTITTLLIESSALYAVNSLLLIGLWVSHSDVTNIFLPTLAEIQVRAFARSQSPDRLSKMAAGWTEQVIAPLLIIKRTADGSLTSETTVSVRKAKVPTTLASLIYNA